MQIPNKIYLCGPMSGYPEHNYPAFDKASSLLRKDGYNVFSPHENFGGDVGRSREEYMAVDLTNVIDADGIVLLPGWGESQGCNTEVMTAWQCAKPAYRFEWADAEDDKKAYCLSPMDITPPRLPYSTDPVPLSESILIEAERLVNGPRRSLYGHPLDDYARVAGMANSLFSELLHPDKEFGPEHMPMFMECVKLSREFNCPKRDNRTDGAGYWGVIDMIHTERVRRSKLEVFSICGKKGNKAHVSTPSEDATN